MLNPINKFGTQWQENISHGLNFFGLGEVMTTWIVVFITIAVVLLASAICFYIMKHYVLSAVEKKMRQREGTWSILLLNHRVIHRLLHIFPAFIIYACSSLMEMAPLIFSFSLSRIVNDLAICYMLLCFFYTSSALLSAAEARYVLHSFGDYRPIKGYIQIIRMFLFVITAILIVAQILNKSPVYLLTSIGAVATVGLVAFKDAILGFVANIQLSSEGLVRVGDRIEIPEHGVEGDIIDISLSRVKVQNSDKTIVTIPTYLLLNSGMKNWRGVNEAGGRRIKRAFNIDINTIKFCDLKLLESLKEKGFLSEKLYRTLTSSQHNVTAKTSFTNSGVFRAYLKEYFDNHPKIHQKMTRVVHYLEPTPTGLPIEIYMFTTDTDWANYEEIQADISDHVFAVLPHFELDIFQHISDPSLKLRQLSIKKQSLEEQLA